MKMASSVPKKNGRVTISKKDGRADPIMPVVRKFLWFAAIAAVAFYSTSQWGIQMREQLGQWWYALIALIGE